MNTFVLDTSALLAMRFDEAGMELVKDMLQDARHEHCRVLMSTLSQVEVFYRICRLHDKAEAYRTHIELKMLPIEFVPPDEDILLNAGEFKAEYAMSLADALIAATAKRRGAVLVHKDPEFEALDGKVALKALPYKR